MINLLYQLGIHAFNLAFWMLSLFNSKAVKRRFGLRDKTNYSSTKNILVHCASAGEFEQIQPIIKGLKKSLPDRKFIVSFFSSSGVEWVKKKNIDIDHCYFPSDSSKAVNEFLDRINPTAVIIAKNEFWFNFLANCNKRDIPLFHVAVAFKENHFLLKYDFFRSILQKSKQIWALDAQSLERGIKYLTNIQFGGDPRIDRITSQASILKFPERLHAVIEKKIIVYASVHKEDISIINSAITNKNYSHIIVPHHVNEREIKYFLEQLSTPCIRYSNYTEEHLNMPLLVDNIGMLSSLYSQATYSYIGGGFGSGIHNILESAIFGNIIFIGPRNDHFPEARIMKSSDAIREISKSDNLNELISSLSSTDINEMRSKMSSFFHHHQGASDKITKELLKYFQ